MATPVSLADLEMAIDSLSDMHDIKAYVSRSTGRVFVGGFDGMQDDDFPEDTSDPDLVVVPSRRDLDLGSALARRFGEEIAPQWRGEIRACFSRKGAYRCFRALLERTRLLDQWYAFQSEQTRIALRAWAEEEGFEVVEP